MMFIQWEESTCSRCVREKKTLQKRTILLCFFSSNNLSFFSIKQVVDFFLSDKPEHNCYRCSEKKLFQKVDSFIMRNLSNPHWTNLTMYRQLVIILFLPIKWDLTRSSYMAMENTLVIVSLCWGENLILYSKLY